MGLGWESTSQVAELRLQGPNKKPREAEQEGQSGR
jgi:hypothetical protein